MSLKNYYLVLSFHFFLSFLGLNGQNFYSGSVLDKNDNPIIGASVFLKNTAIGTQTGFDGNFIIDANIQDILVVMYIGFDKQEINLTSEYDLGIIYLTENIEQLDEVVIVGYGSQKKEILTSSVSSVKGDDLTIEPVINPIQALQGKASGVNIIASDAPGTSSQVIIRGLGTVLAGREPLYVVDGILTNNINNINTADIEKISILKDAASLAIYGNRGANGVLIVTTKSGKEGKISISFDSNVGIRNINYKPKMADTNSFVTYANEAILWNLLTDSNPNNDNGLSVLLTAAELIDKQTVNELSLKTLSRPNIILTSNRANKLGLETRNKPCSVLIENHWSNDDIFSVCMPLYGHKIPILNGVVFENKKNIVLIYNDKKI